MDGINPGVESTKSLFFGVEVGEGGGAQNAPIAVIAGIAGIERDRQTKTLPRMNTDGRGLGCDRKTPETVPFKMRIAPIRVNQSSKRKYVSRILRAGTLKGSRPNKNEILSRDSSRTCRYL